MNLMFGTMLEPLKTGFIHRSRNQSDAAYNRLRLIIIFILLVIGLGPALSGLAVIYYESKREMIESSGQYFKEVSSFAANEIEISLRDKISMSFWLASIPTVRALLLEPSQSSPKEIATLRKIVMPEFASRDSVINIYRVNGDTVFTSDIVRGAPPLPPLPSDFFHKRQAYVDVVTGSGDDDVRFRLDIFTPSFNSAEKPVGVIHLSSSVDRLFDRVRGLRMGSTGHNNLVDSDATILFCSLYQLTAHHIDRSLFDKIGAEENGWLRSDEKSHDFSNAIIGFARVDLTDLRVHPDSYRKKKWRIFTTQDPEETGEPLSDYRVVVGSYGVALTLFTLLLGIIAFRMILNAQRKHDGELVSKVKAESIRQLLQSYHQLSIDSLTEVEALLNDCENNEVTPRTSKRIQKIRRGLATVGSALDHLSYFAGTGTLSLGKVKLGDLIEETMSMLEHLISQAHLTTLFNRGEYDGSIVGDERLLRLVLLNLIMNACQAVNGKSGNLTIDLSGDAQKEATISISDNGKGVEASEIEKIFDPFYSTKKGASQRGLGLAATLGIVEAHHGKITFESSPGKGSRVIVTLPVGE